MSQQPKSRETRDNKNKENKKHSKTRKPMNNEKLEKKLTKFLNKIEKDNKNKEDMLKLNKEYGQKIQILLGKVKNSQKQSDELLVNEFNQIQQGRKNELRKLKQQQKEYRKQRKEKRRFNRKNRQSKKDDKKNQLDSSRIEELPEIKNDLKFITILVDGWNICGCDKIARKSMRGRRVNGAKRIIQLLQLFRNNSNYCSKNGNDNINITIHFDGNGKDLDLKDDKILVKYSSKKEIVDDRLVRELGLNIKNIKDFKINKKPYEMNNNENPNRNFIVITSDRELTIRLNNIGVTCMKSGCFYKTYLKPLAFTNEDNDEDNNINNNNEEKKQKDDKKPKPKNKTDKEPVWKKYIKHKTFSDDSSSSSSSTSSDEDEF